MLMPSDESTVPILSIFRSSNVVFAIPLKLVSLVQTAEWCKDRYKDLCTEVTRWLYKDICRRVYVLVWDGDLALFQFCVNRYVILSLLYKIWRVFLSLFFLLISTLNLYKGEEYLFVISLTYLFLWVTRRMDKWYWGICNYKSAM